MKEVVLGSSMSLIKKNFPDYDTEKLEVIRYGLESLYLFITKFVIITIVALLLGIFKEYIIFCILYNIIRMPSFGLHATKSWICLVTSLLIFVIAPFICSNYIIPYKLFLGMIAILLMFKNSPADTKYKPIINPKRRLFYKITSTIIAILYVVVALRINNNFMSNALILSLIIQIVVISPLTYKLFKLPYDNYKNYN